MLGPRPRLIGQITFAAWAALGWAAASRAAIDERVVINEIAMTPSAGRLKFVEIVNTRATPVDLGDWWICDQPTQMIYRRLRQIPRSPGFPPTSPGIVLGPGDYLVIHFRGPPPGGYMTRPNESGTVTHIVNSGVPDGAVLMPAATNFSIWDETGLGDFPEFTLPQLMRDFSIWSVTGIYTGAKRGCVAANPIAALWPPNIAGDCVSGEPEPQFVAVDSSRLTPESDLSINYNGRGLNDVPDYFIAPATEGERNVMPGDLDGDFDMDEDDFDAFAGCLDQPATEPGCGRADLDGSGTVDCEDWPLFLENWRLYSTEPEPGLPPCEGCIPGDSNGDGVVDGRDIQVFLNVVTGADNIPMHRCAADGDGNGQFDCADELIFARLVLGSPTPCRPGDANIDGRADGRDIDAFVRMLFEPPACPTVGALCGADANVDFQITLDDVEPFVEALLTAE